MASTEDKAYEIMKELDVDYVLVIFGGLTGYSSDGKLSIKRFIKHRTSAIKKVEGEGGRKCSFRSGRVPVMWRFLIVRHKKQKPPKIILFHKIRCSYRPN